MLVYTHHRRGFDLLAVPPSTSVSYCVHCRLLRSRSPLTHQLLAKEALVGDCARQPEGARNVRRLLTCLRVEKVSRGVPERHKFLLAGRRRGWMEHLARSLRCRPLCLCIARSPKQAPAPRCRWLDMKSRWMPAPGFCATPSWCTVTHFCGEPILKRGHVEASKRSSLHRVRSASAA